LNQILHRDGLDNRYATSSISRSSRARGACATSTPGTTPFLLREGGPETLAASSLPLGMMAVSPCAEGLLTIEPGDLLVSIRTG